LVIEGTKYQARRFENGYPDSSGNAFEIIFRQKQERKVAFQNTENSKRNYSANTDE